MQARTPASLSCLLAATTLTIACLGAATSVCAESIAWSRVDDESLEDFFWHCDLRSAREALSAGDGAACVSAADELKARRFGGDFALLVAWWQAHKPAERARRETAQADEKRRADAQELALQAP